MSDLKFVCPACGQHMECARAYVGHQTHCPGCGAEIRVPLSNSAGGAPGALPRAELILHAETATPEIHPPPGPITPSWSPGPIPGRPGTPSPPREQVIPPTAAPEDSRAMLFVCPVCRSSLRVYSDGRSEIAPGGSIDPSPASAHAAPKDLPLSERERQIAAAREAHQISLYPPMKPRLAYILPEQPPPNKDGDQKSMEEEPRSGPEIRTLNE